MNPKPRHQPKKLQLGKGHLLILGGLGMSSFIAAMLHSALPPDTQCTSRHETTTRAPTKLDAPEDYLAQGDYLYDLGDCELAITAYNQAIGLKPSYAEAYNNRAYTYMRRQLYAPALIDLDRAIELRPKYVNARMNRADIYNYYYNVDYNKALADYDVVLEQNPNKPVDGSLCGHRLLAMNKGWSLNVFWQLLTKGIKAGCLK